MYLVVEQLLNGLQFGLLLFLLAAGLTLVFGIMDFVNLAHGSLYMMGAYFAATFVAWTGSFVLGALLALGATLLLGVALGETEVAVHQANPGVLPRHWHKFWALRQVWKHAQAVDHAQLEGQKCHQLGQADDIRSGPSCGIEVSDRLWGGILGVESQKVRPIEGRG